MTELAWVQAMGEGGADAIFILDPDCRIVRSNPAAAALTGYGRADLLQVGFTDLLDPDHSETPKELRGLLWGGETFPVDLPMRRKDGSRFWGEADVRTFRQGDTAFLHCSVRDITLWKRVRLRLEERERELEAIIESTGDGIMVVAGGGKVLHCNHRFSQMWSLPERVASDGPSDRLMELVAPQLTDPEGFLKRVRRLYGSAEASFDPIHLRDGRSFECFSRPFLLEGRVVGRVWSFRDVTHRKQARDRIREGERRILAILESAHEGIVLFDQKARVEAWNPFMEAITGVPASEVMGMRPQEGVPLFSSPQTVEATRSALSGIPSATLDCRFLQPETKERVWAAVRVTPLRSFRGGAAGAIGTVSDITARKRAEEALQRSEERFRMAFERAPISLGHVDLEGKIVAANQMFRDFLGYHDEDLVGKRVLDITHPEDQAGSASQLEKVASPTALFAMEKRYLRKDGSTVWGRVHGRTISGEDGKPLYVVFGVEDITQRKAMEEELENSRDLLRALAARLESGREEERSSVSRELHDDLGQKIAALRIDLDWLKNRMPSPDPLVNHRLEEMLLLSDDLGETIHQISSQLRPPMLDLLGLGPAIEWHVLQRAEHAGVHVEFSLEKEPGNLNHGIRIAAFRIVQEAVTNVLQHAAAASLKVHMEFSGGFLILGVRDDGVGFDTSGIGGEGHALGLLGMRERVESLGGKLILDSEEGKGTQVRARIPLQPREEN